MTPFPALGAGLFRRVRLGERAAAALAAELARHPGPKTGLLVGAGPDSPVLAAMIGALTPEDTLTVVTERPGDPDSGASVDAVRATVAAQGPWAVERVRVVGALAEADPADVVVLGTPVVVGTADECRSLLDDLGKRVNPGGVLSAATVVLRSGGAADELDRQAALYGVGTDLVVRNLPPVRIHRLRFTPADPALVGGLAPVERPSSVRLTRTMSIDSNGVAAAGIVLGLAAIAKAARPRSRMWLVPALAAAPVAAFFRDPQRDVAADRRAVVAASDGTVLSVQRVRDERFGPEEYLRIAVFLSVLDVHVNRSPVAGTVVDQFVEDGGYAAAMKPAAEHNVSAYTVLDTGTATVVVAQRTGLLARRIVLRAPVGAVLAKGERFGLIRFGSRTDVYLPAAQVSAQVAPGDKVRGGVTVIARWR
jgi:phosphatidylserine decarboxylase